LKKIALAAPSTAPSTASSKTIGALAAQLQGQLLQVAGPRGRDDQLADLGGTGEGHRSERAARTWPWRARGLQPATACWPLASRYLPIITLGGLDDDGYPVAFFQFRCSRDESVITAATVPASTFTMTSAMTAPV
jgi:hypothetical protein